MNIKRKIFKSISFPVLCGILVLISKLAAIEITENLRVVWSFATAIDSIDYSILPRSNDSEYTPRIGLALSGGGLRGVAQIGVLTALEEARIEVDRIVGTSIGGAIGALYASGYTPDEILDIVYKTDWSTLLSDSPKRSLLFLGEKEKRARALIQFRVDHFEPVIPEAYSPGQKIYNTFTDLVLNSYYQSADFENLKIPLTIISTDMVTGQKVVLKKGNLAQAMRATVAIPLLFAPVQMDGLALVDGGVISNIPVEDTRALGADIVIAVDTTSPLRGVENLQAPWEIADQITTIMQQKNDLAQMQQADIQISFADLKIVSTDLKAIDFLYQQGIQRTREKI